MKKVGVVEMNIYVIGLGAVGALYSSFLAKNPNIRLFALMDQDRYEKAIVKGIEVNHHPLRVQYVSPKMDRPKADLIIFATKNRQLEDTFPLVKQIVNDQTLFLSLLNGISSEERIGQYFGEKNVLYAICNGLDAGKVGNQVTFKEAGVISLGEKKDGPPSKRVQKVAEILTTAGIQTLTPQYMRDTLWYKFMINVGVNQVSALSGLTYGQLTQSTDGLSLVAKAMKEVISLALYEKVQLKEQQITDFFANILPKLDPNGKTSMLQDIQQKRLTEVEEFAGKVKELGFKHQIQTPVNDVLYDLLRAINGKGK